MDHEANSILARQLARREDKKSQNIRKAIGLLISVLCAFGYIFVQSILIERRAKSAISEVLENAASTSEEKEILSSVIDKTHSSVFSKFYHKAQYSKGSGRRVAFEMPWLDEKQYINTMLTTVREEIQKTGKAELTEKVVFVHIAIAASIPGIDEPSKEVLQSLDRVQTAAPKDIVPLTPVAQPVAQQPVHEFIGFRVKAGLIAPLDAVSVTSSSVDVYYANASTSGSSCRRIGTISRVRSFTPENGAVLELDLATSDGAQMHLKLNEDVGSAGVCLTKGSNDKENFGKNSIAEEENCACYQSHDFLQEESADEISQALRHRNPSQLSVPTKDYQTRMAENLGVERIAQNKIREEQNKKRLAAEKERLKKLDEARRKPAPPNPDPNKYMYVQNPNTGVWARQKKVRTEWVFETFVDEKGQPTK